MCEMSAEWIVSPRRAPRSHARCRAHVLAPGGPFDTGTEDIGSRGCQIIAPRAVGRGAPLELSIASDRLPDSLRVQARVAWASTDAPFRLGVAFDDAALDRTERWVERLVAASGLPPLRRVPDRIAADAMVWLGTPPRFVVDFTREEALLLRAVGSATVAELRAGLRDGWPPAQRALFSLLAHQHLTLSRGASVHPESWRKILSEAEASLAIEDLRAPPPVPQTPSPWPVQPVRTPVPERRAYTPVPEPRTSTPVPGRPAQTPPPMQRAHTPVPGEGRAAARSLDLGGGWGAPAAPPAPDFDGAGVGWRAQRDRPPEAQGCFDLARAEIAAGRVAGALALLRRALALAPGDREIAAELGKLAFKDRTPVR
jgi:hypothetical protein